MAKKFHFEVAVKTRVHRHYFKKDDCPFFSSGLELFPRWRSAKESFCTWFLGRRRQAVCLVKEEGVSTVQSQVGFGSSRFQVLETSWSFRYC
ncbi:hypothetical protein AVEN_3469-1 [Araneus ventricosus]|uniref:Uncharacterized protein n=1 Tax=Araneus ventricosus TaxID=182803 RepID=A0A4Y2PCV1_ARAVE|nr:hypothetical protein AVEN_3469-1 [Araneus ventricosus]